MDSAYVHTARSQCCNPFIYDGVFASDYKMLRHQKSIQTVINTHARLNTTIACIPSLNIIIQFFIIQNPSIEYGAVPCHRYDVKTENQQQSITKQQQQQLSSGCVCVRSVVCSDNCPYHILYFWLDNIDRQLNRQLTHIHILHRILINWMQSKINFPMINTERESSEQTPNKRKICKLESTNYNNNRLVFPDKFRQICLAFVYFRFMCFLFIFPSNRESFWIA